MYVCSTNSLHILTRTSRLFTFFHFLSLKKLFVIYNKILILREDKRRIHIETEQSKYKIAFKSSGQFEVLNSITLSQSTNITLISSGRHASNILINPSAFYNRFDLDYHQQLRYNLSSRVIHRNSSTKCRL